MALVWATVAEVRAYLGDELPPTTEYGDDALQRDIDRATRTLEATIIRWPALNPDTDRAEDEGVRDSMVAAVAETVAKRVADRRFEDSLGGMAPILAAGGTISTGKLSASTVGRGGSARGTSLGADRLPMAAIEALAAAGLIGGGVTSW